MSRPHSDRGVLRNQDLHNHHLSPDEEVPRHERSYGQVQETQDHRHSPHRRQNHHHHQHQQQHHHHDRQQSRSYDPEGVNSDPPSGSSHSSPLQSMPQSPHLSPQLRGRKRVGFHVAVDGSDDRDAERSDSLGDLAPVDRPRPPNIQLPPPVSSHLHQQQLRPPPPAQINRSAVDPMELTQSLKRLSRENQDQRQPKSALRKGVATPDVVDELDLAGIEDLSAKQAAYESARARASGLERDVHSAPGSRSVSPTRKLASIPGTPRSSSRTPGHRRQISSLWNTLFHMGGEQTGQATPEAEEMDDYFPRPERYRVGGLSAHLHMLNLLNPAASSSRSDSVSTSATLRNDSIGEGSSGTNTPPSPEPRSPGWFSRSPRNSTYSINDLVRSSGATTGFAGNDFTNEFHKQTRRPAYNRSASSGSIDATLKSFQQRRKAKAPVDITIKKHIEQTETRKKYMIKLCKALMEYGAPTHRLEAYMAMTSRVLEIQAQFLYFPGTMLIAFDDTLTHTTEMKLVKIPQGVNLAKMKDVHAIYKDVVHDIIGVQVGLDRLDQLNQKVNRFPIWAMILAHGFGAATIAPVAFDGRLIDLPIAFTLGCILGFLQLVIAPRSDLYAGIFEIGATIVTSFLSRMFGTIGQGQYFCFSALAQSSIVMILPGFTVLSAALELQSRSLIAGSVRIVYAVIYSLWLGYGITIGIAIYGIIDPNAVNQASCDNPLANNSQWSFFFVPAFTLCLMILNQAKWKQMPVMLIISFAGYQVNYWSGKRFAGNAQVASTLGALAIGVLANLYSRLGRKIQLASKYTDQNLEKYDLFGKKKNQPKIISDDKADKAADAAEEDIIHFLDILLPERFRSGNAKKITDVESGPLSATASAKKASKINYTLAAAAMLPAIFVQVPSGLSVTGSLVQGLESANQINHVNSTNFTVVTQAGLTNQTDSATGNISFTVAASVVQIAIGITVGLFLGGIVVYPFGKGSTIGTGKKSRSGLFAF